MAAENGKTECQEATAERELEELRRAIEESRGRRRRANEAFDEFIKGFGEARRDPVPVPQPLPPLEREQQGHAEHKAPAEEDQPIDEPKPVTPLPLDDFAPGAPFTERAPLRSIPAALALARRSPTSRIVPVVAIAVVVVLAAFLLWRGRSQEEAPPPAAVSAPSPAAAEAPAAPAAATSGTDTPPSAEISTTRLVWLRVTVDGERVVEREVAEGTKIPLNAGSRIVIRAGDAGAVRVSIAGKDQGLLGPAGQVASRTFTLKP